MANLIRDIMKTTDRQVVKKLCKTIGKQVSLQSEQDVTNGLMLIEWLFVYGEYEKAVRVCDELFGEYRFGENSAVGDLILSAKTIQARIYRQSGRGDEAKAILNALSDYRDFTVFPNLVGMISTVYDDRINTYQTKFIGKGFQVDFAIEAIAELKLRKMAYFILFQEFGDYPADPAWVEDQLNAVLHDLRQY